MKHITRITIILALGSVAVCCAQAPNADSDLPVDDVSAAPKVTAKGWAIADGKTGKLLWGHRADEQLKAASTAKIMTAHIILQLAKQDHKVLDKTVTFSKFADDTEGSAAGIAAGESLTVRDCLYGLLLPSGNDCGNALAEHFNAAFPPPEKPSARPGANFIAEMNRAARRLELAKTSYSNPYSDGEGKADRTASAQDLTKLAWHAMQDPLFRQYVGTKSHTCSIASPSGSRREKTWKNTNELLHEAGFDGVKTGTTKVAGCCLVSSGRRGEDHLLVAVIGSDSNDSRYADTRALFDWAWQQRKAAK